MPGGRGPQRRSLGRAGGVPGADRAARQFSPARNAGGGRLCGGGGVAGGPIVQRAGRAAAGDGLPPRSYAYRGGTWQPWVFPSGRRPPRRSPSRTSRCAHTAGSPTRSPRRAADPVGAVGADQFWARGAPGGRRGAMAFRGRIRRSQAPPRPANGQRHGEVAFLAAIKLLARRPLRNRVLTPTVSIGVRQAVNRILVNFCYCIAQARFFRPASCRRESRTLPVARRCIQEGRWAWR